MFKLMKVFLLDRAYGKLLEKLLNGPRQIRRIRIKLTSYIQCEERWKTNFNRLDDIDFASVESGKDYGRRR